MKSLIDLKTFLLRKIYIVCFLYVVFKMYNKCDLCGKFIEDMDDCKLVQGEEGKVKTYCINCYKKRQAK